ncbi:tumor necrosis factor receptor superfamily member 12A isoform X2 [Pseudophryne corroboree]|uniref:tumor necrosis factor receptor superfamily member 12A isoform X2 n=1 Tax=Pseudophryne corroboree TaxID=495146 RepID=UPI003081A69E
MGERVSSSYILYTDKTTCEKGRVWSDDLGKCKDCSLCETSSKDDFCQKCDATGAASDFPWLIVGCASGVAFLVLTVALSLTIFVTRLRRKNKFTTPIEETGAHSAEALLIH